MKKCNCNHWVTASRLGLFLVILFAVCFAWYWLRPVNQAMHMQFMEMSFYGFSGMNFVSFVLGAAQAFIWGLIVYWLWAAVVGCCRK